MQHFYMGCCALSTPPAICLLLQRKHTRTNQQHTTLTIHCTVACVVRLPAVRYTEVVGKGRFKQIYKAFDTQIGIDVAWSKISAEPHHLSDEQLQNIVSEMTKGLDLEHPNIIKCFECWEDEQRHCINLITELFTSGNLRQYRNLHKHLDLKVQSCLMTRSSCGLSALWGC